MGRKQAGEDIEAQSEDESQLVVRQRAIRHMAALDDAERRRLIQAINRLAEDPVHARPGADIRQLTDQPIEHVYRLRVGDHRVVYYLEDGLVWVFQVFERDAGYDTLRFALRRETRAERFVEWDATARDVWGPN